MTDLLEAARPTAQPRLSTGPGPRRRPPVVLRAAAGVAGLVVSMFVAALMLSDRAPAVVEQVFGARARRLWERVDASGRVDFVTAERVPEGDTVIHVAAWAIVMLLVAVAVWSWRWLLVSAPGVWAASIVIELGQGRWADTRTVEVSDVVANGVGVAAGATAAVVLYLAWSAGAALVAAAMRPRRSTLS